MTGKEQTEHLAQKWAHSHEEDTGGAQVFRPSSYSFPPSRRGREVLALNADGTFHRSVPGPDDRNAPQPGGVWEVQGSHLVLREHAGQPREFSIAEVQPDRLVLRPISGSS